MPLYDYKCDDCDHEFEKQVPLVDFDKFQSCPWMRQYAYGHMRTCNGKARRVTRGTTGIQFKGSGWTGKSGQGRVK